MLTLILLVVLGGGAGLLAVSLSDHRAPWAALRERRNATSLGPYRGAHSATEDDAGPAPEGGAAPRDAPHDQEQPFVVDSGRANGAAGVAPAYRRTSSVPRSQVALEGSYTDVAVAPWWRRLLSVALMVGIVGLMGVGIAIVLGASITAVAQLLDRAIG